MQKEKKGLEQILSNNVFPCIFFVISRSGAKNSTEIFETRYEVTKRM
jgi:hypothetical protein